MNRPKVKQREKNGIIIHIDLDLQTTCKTLTLRFVLIEAKSSNDLSRKEPARAPETNWIQYRLEHLKHLLFSLEKRSTNRI